MRLITLACLISVEAMLCSRLAQHDLLSKRQGLAGIIVDLTAKAIGAGKVADPLGAAPRRVEIASPVKLPSVKRVKIRSGPYSVPNMGKKSLNGHAGMLENYPDTAVEKPCAGECTLLSQQAGLEYADGTNANINTGMWLHHMVHINSGPERWDAAGIGRFCLPHFGLGVSPATAERFFSSGNERTQGIYNTGTDMNSGTGYHVRKEDKFMYLVELMNMNMEDKVVYVTMTYDILEGPLPAGWNEIKVAWLDANQCSTSEVVPPKENGSFTISSKPWTPNFEGNIVSAVGHLHDGGVSVDIMASPNTALCKTNTKYAESPEYAYRGTSMGGDKTSKDHISSMDGCKPGDYAVKEMNKSQSWLVNGNYDYSVHDGNLEKQKQSDIMAIAIVFVQVPPGPVAKPRSRVVENMTAVLTGKQRFTSGKQQSSPIEGSNDLFLRVLHNPPSLCVAKIATPMDACQAV